MSWTWILTALSIAGMLLNARRNAWCFPLWAVTNVAWAIIDYRAEIYSQATLQVVFLGAAVYGWREWRK